MTSVPKPLKFLRPHFKDLQSIFYSWGTKQEYEQAQQEDEEVKQELLITNTAEKAEAGQRSNEAQPKDDQSSGPSKTDTTSSNPISETVAPKIESSQAPKAETSSKTVPPPPPFKVEPGSVHGVSTADRTLLADIISVLAMTYSDTGLRETLSFRLRGHKLDQAHEGEDPGVWGHEYVRHLAAEIGEAYLALQSKLDLDNEGGFETDEQSSRRKDLHQLAMKLVPFLLSHNGEADAVDLLLELESIDDIVPLVGEREF